MKTSRQWLLAAILIAGCNIILSSCCNEDDSIEHPAKEHTEATNELIRLLDENPEVKALLGKSITRAAQVNPDRAYIQPPTTMAAPYTDVLIRA